VWPSDFCGLRCAARPWMGGGDDRRPQKMNAIEGAA